MTGTSSQLWLLMLSWVRNPRQLSLDLLQILVSPFVEEIVSDKTILAHKTLVWMTIFSTQPVA